MKQMSHQKNKQFKDLLLLFNALEQLYEELERILTSLRLCLNNERVQELLDEALTEDVAQRYIKDTKEDLDALELTYDRVKKEFEDVRERNEIETHREYF